MVADQEFNVTKRLTSTPIIGSWTTWNTLLTLKSSRWCSRLCHFLLIHFSLGSLVSMRGIFAERKEVVDGGATPSANSASRQPGETLRTPL